MIKEKIHRFFSEGNARTILTKKNIAASFGIKGITILISLILIPLTINYVNSDRNGIWQTLYSMVMWLNLFDIGLGNGMRNKLAEAKAKGETELAKKYISSTYAIVGLICVAIFAVFCFINPYLDWFRILGSGKTLYPYRSEISGLVWIMMASFCCTFILNLIKSIVTADQRPAIGSFLDLLGQILTLTGIYILSKTTPPSLVYLGWITGFAPVIIYFIAGFVLFNTRYKEWRPSFRYVDFKLSGNMMNLGIKFFIATMAVIMVNQTLSFLILRMTDPVEVTNYNTTFRLFNIAFNIMGIVLIPYWSSFTDAYTKNDFEWMKKSVSHLHRLFVFFLIFQAILLIFSPIIYYVFVNYWITESVNLLKIPFLMSFAVCLSVCVLCWMSIYMNPLNGIGKIKLQVYSSLLEMALLIPVALLLGHYWGVIGILLAPVFIYIPRMIWAPIQVNKLMNQTATGLWNQ
ncbi:MAG: MATE family efflux transporter [Dysgonamonadaceae bacterium]|jgi:O-antigen/teichoic acid export membrane protein|nr:MATE family efflux transporter [Dysgonamonadaceae bacterium]